MDVLDNETLLSLQDFIAEISCKDEDKVEIRINIKTESDVQKWLTAYKTASNTDVIVKDPMSAEPKRYIYHRKFSCQLSSRNKKEDSKRNQNCPVEIDILIKKLTKDTKKNDEYLKKPVPLQGLIKIKGRHSHQTDNFQALKYLRVLPETKEEFYEYFSNGCGPAEAILACESKLLVEDGDRARLSNALINPLPRTVYHLHQIWLKSNYGIAWSSVEPLDKLKEKIEKYKSEGVEVHVDDTDKSRWCISVVTPIMKRAQALPESSEIIFTDSTGSCDAQQSILTLIITATKGGATPLCALIHNRLDTEGYTQAYAMLAKHYPKCFGNKEAPEVFMTDDCSAEKAALLAIWPNAEQYLCHFHIGQAEWRWLCESKNKVDQNQRQHLLKMFQKILYAVDTQEYEEAKENFQINCSHEGYKKRVEAFLLREREWAKIFRAETTNRGHNTNNFSEASIRVIKDNVMHRTKAYNCCAMVDFVAHPWEDHQKLRLLHYAYDRNSKPRLLFDRLSQKMPEDLADMIVEVEEDLYNVPSEKTGELTYEVNALIGWCSCPVGKCGAFCKHQALVYKKFRKGFPNKPAITYVERHKLAMLALGPDECPPPNFFREFNEPEVEENMEVQQEEQPPQQENIPAEENLSNSQEPASTADDAVEEADNLEKEEILEGLKQQFKEQIDRLHDLAKDTAGETYGKTLKAIVQRLKRPQTPAQAIATLLNMRRESLSMAKRRGEMHVQPANISKRKEGKSRGAKRIRAGRPYKHPSSQIQSSQKNAKLPRKLAASVCANKTHIKSHQRK